MARMIDCACAGIEEDDEEEEDDDAIGVLASWIEANGAEALRVAS